MENGKIGDDQITSKKSPNSPTEPLKSRLRSNGTWCPKTEVLYHFLYLSNVLINFAHLSNMLIKFAH